MDNEVGIRQTIRLYVLLGNADIVFSRSAEAPVPRRRRKIPVSLQNNDSMERFKFRELLKGRIDKRPAHNGCRTIQYEGAFPAPAKDQAFVCEDTDSLPQCDLGDLIIVAKLINGWNLTAWPPFSCCDAFA